MEDLIRINITIPENCTKEDIDFFENIRKSIKELFEPLVQLAKERNFWHSSIKAIIITDKYENDIGEQAKLLNQTVILTKEKEYTGISKSLYNYNHENPARIIFFPIRIIYLKDNFSQIVLGQFINAYSDSILPASLIEYHALNPPLKNLDDYIKKFLTIWISTCYGKQLEKAVFVNYKNELNANSVFNGFCRKLKRDLFEYNSDIGDNISRIDTFGNKTFPSFCNLILRLIEIKTINGELTLKNKKYEREILSVLEEIAILTEYCKTNFETIDILPIKKLIKDFFIALGIDLKETPENKGLGIFFTENPKDYFKNELVDTEPRFVCFIDILGFQEMIDNYEAEDTSSVLQDIQEAFEESIKLAKGEDNSKYQQATRYLEYKLFSDCVSISIPYFNNENDFLSNLNLICAFVRGFQSIMMSKNFFIRGAISLGSYYSDSNIIFSKGLVTAYQLESKKAIYPRIIIDNQIVKKLLAYDHKRVKYFGLDNTIIFDWENIAFLNSFKLIESTINQFESMISVLDTPNDNLLTGIAVSIAKNVSQMTIGLLKDSVNKEKMTLERIKNKIIENIFIHQENENIVSKYTWLLEFIKWLEKDETGKLKFQYLTQKLDASNNY